MARFRNFSVSDYIVHGIYFFLYGFVKYVPPPVGNALRWLCTRPFTARLGRARIGEAVTIWYPYRIRVARDVTINEFCVLSGFGGISIGAGVRIGHRSTIYTTDHEFNDPNVPVRKQGLVTAPVSIGDDVWIGCNVTILKGVTIGTGAVVGAGAVVNGDIPPYAVAAGVPARVIRMRSGDVA